MRFPLDAERAAVIDAVYTDADNRAALLVAPTARATDRYTGVLYRALDYAHLDRTQRRRVDTQVVVFSGLWGLVAPSDAIPPYRCPINSRPPGLGGLASWWRPRLSSVVDAHVDGRVVWDLLPGEYLAAWPRSDAPARRIAVRFLDDVVRDGHRRLITVSHWNTLLKGALVRHVLEHQVVDPDELHEFGHPQGYRYVPDLTEETDSRVIVSLVARRD